MNAFVVIVEEALSHFHDTNWLGTYSVLATPYFLGDYLVDEPERDNAQIRGEILQSVIIDSANHMWPGVLPDSKTDLSTLAKGVSQEKGDKRLPYLFLILELQYFRRFFSVRTFPTTATDIYEFLNTTKESLLCSSRTSR
ncbi:MAG: hypothetical protein R2932_10390 [Caldilineaceae bacterium]